MSGPDDHVVEIGAGLGSLTMALAETGATITAIEVDHGIAGASARRSSPISPNVTVVEADALRLDWKSTLAAAPRWVLVANLPYNVATPLVCDLLDFVPPVERMLVMVQREVAERLCAAAGSDAYGAVSVKVAYWATARIAGTVPASVFLPRPKVESALADIRRRPAPAVDVAPEPLFQLVRTAFGQRRKMLRRSLADVVAPEVFDAAGIDAQRRPEELDVVEWGALTTRVAGGHVTQRVVVDGPGQADARACASPAFATTATTCIDAEMVTLDWHDTLTIDPQSTGLTADGPYRDGHAARSSRTSCRRPCGSFDRRPRVHIHKALPHGGGLGGGSADAAAMLRWAGFDDSVRRGRPGRRRRRSASSEAAPRCAGSARSSSRCRSSRSTSRW